MRVRINNGLNLDYRYGEYVEPLNETQPIILVFDPGKTNMAAVIGNAFGDPIMVLEFSGTGMDTSQYCQEFKRYLIDLLRGCHIIDVSQEEAILKDGKMSEGFKYYKSNMVLTEIRAMLIDLAFQLTGKKPYHINNWSWKFDILPKGFRGPFQKGSKLWFESINSPYASYSHDVTDVICMYIYRSARLSQNASIKCTEVQKRKHNYAVSFVGRELVPSGCKQFIYNPEFTCEQNVIYFTNCSEKLGSARLPIDLLTLKDIYKYSSNMFTDSDPYLLVKRK